MSAHATPKLTAYVGLGGLGLSAALALQRPEPLALAIPFLLAVTLALALARPPELTFTTRVTPDRLLEGETATLEVAVGGATGGRLELLPLWPAGVAPTDPARVVALAPRAGQSVSVAVRGARWGGYTVGGLLVRAYDPFGLLVWTQRLPARSPLRVFPRPAALRALPRPAETQMFAGNELARESGEGIEFAAVREFTPGDRVRSINWRASAQRGRLAVNVRHPERNADVVIFLDAFADLRRDNASTLDLAVRAATALVERYLQRHDRVGLVSYGGTLRWLTPASGVAQRYRIVEALLDTHVVLSYAWRDVAVLPARTLPPQALVVALTPLLDERAVQALLDLRGRGFDLTVIEVSPLSFVPQRGGAADEAARRLWALQRDLQRQQFRSRGVPIATWEPERPLEAVIQEVRASRHSSRLVRA